MPGGIGNQLRNNVLSQAGIVKRRKWRDLTGSSINSSAFIPGVTLKDRDAINETAGGRRRWACAGGRTRARASAGGWTWRGLGVAGTAHAAASTKNCYTETNEN